MDKIYKIYSQVWKNRCKNFPNESTIGVIEEIPKNIYVLGDLHGDWNKTIESLRKANLIDKNNKWSGKDSILVQLGDQVDRCRFNGTPCHMEGATINDEASDMKLLYYFTELHNQAVKKGGAVYSILGNHELMNVTGDFRYVSRMNLLEFSKDGSVEDGIKNRKLEFKPGNKISNFLACTRKMALVIGKNLFIHAGIVPEIAKKYNVNDMNRIVALFLFDKLENSKNYSDLLINSKKSPLWTRLLGNLNKNTNEDKIKSICNDIFDSGVLNNILGENKKHKIERIFVGHTPQIFKGINTMCNDRIFYVDVGISGAFDQFRSNKINHTMIKITNDEKISFI